MRIEKYLGEKGIKGQWRYVILIIALAVLFTDGFWYVDWNQQYAGWTFRALCILFFVYLFWHWPKNNEKYNFKIEVLLLIFLPFVSSINSYVYYDQPFMDSFYALSGNFVWVIYFMLHRYKVQESTILKAFMCIALFIVAVQVIQQFTYPNTLFGILNESTMIEHGYTDSAEQRNGLWRFRVDANAYFTAPVLFAACTWIRKKVNLKILLIIALSLVSVYLTLTRQVIGACLLAVFLSLFMLKKNKGAIKALILGVSLIAILYSYSDILFGSMAKSTQSDLSDSYIRFLAASYFWNESIKTPFLLLFGYGEPGLTGSFFQYMNYLTSVMGFFTVDVGFIGKIFTTGLIYVFVCYRVLWKLFFTYKNRTPTYIRMFVIFAAVMSIMIFPMTRAMYYLVWSLLLYISDIHSAKNESHIIK
jgi:hypothetical protein